MSIRHQNNSSIRNYINLSVCCSVDVVKILNRFIAFVYHLPFCHSCHQGYCKKHSRAELGTPKKGDKSPRHESSTPKKESEMTDKEKSEARSAKYENILSHFHTIYKWLITSFFFWLNWSSKITFQKCVIFSKDVLNALMHFFFALTE